MTVGITLEFCDIVMVAYISFSGYLFKGSLLCARLCVLFSGDTYGCCASLQRAQSNGTAPAACMGDGEMQTWYFSTLTA